MENDLLAARRDANYQTVLDCVVVMAAGSFKDQPNDVKEHWARELGAAALNLKQMHPDAYEALLVADDLPDFSELAEYDDYVNLVEGARLRTLDQLIEMKQRSRREFFNLVSAFMANSDSSDVNKVRAILEGISQIGEDKLIKYVREEGGAGVSLQSIRFGVSYQLLTELVKEKIDNVLVKQLGTFLFENGYTQRKFAEERIPELIAAREKSDLRGAGAEFRKGMSR